MEKFKIGDYAICVDEKQHKNEMVDWKARNGVAKNCLVPVDRISSKWIASNSLLYMHPDSFVNAKDIESIVVIFRRKSDAIAIYNLLEELGYMCWNGFSLSDEDMRELHTSMKSTRTIEINVKTMELSNMGYWGKPDNIIRNIEKYDCYTYTIGKDAIVLKTKPSVGKVKEVINILTQLNKEV